MELTASLVLLAPLALLVLTAAWVLLAPLVRRVRSARKARPVLLVSPVRPVPPDLREPTAHEVTMARLGRWVR
jgi:hypothetical protein